jgi:hypothetical protein
VTDVSSLPVRGRDFDLACFAVFNRLHDNGCELSMPLVRSMLEELDSNANPAAAYRQVHNWITSTEATRRLGRC